MSTMIMPDLYRHTARKSTVSKNIKVTNVSLCNLNDSSQTCPVYHQAQNSSDKTNFNTLECDIKFEKDLLSLEQSFLILPDNEMEEMSIGEEIEQINCDIIHQIIEEIIQSIEQTSSLISNQNEKCLSTNSDDVHYVINSMINQFDRINEQEFSSNHIEQNPNTSLHEMENDQPVSATSRSQTEDDIIEIEATSNQNSPHSCNCQCHKPLSLSNNEYHLFEQALKQVRLEQQQGKILENNRLIQTLKRQHDELLSIYQQNQKHKQKKTIDREQQTTKYHFHHTQIQTDITTMNQTKISFEQKPILTSNNISHSNEPLTVTRNHSNFNQILPNTSSSLIKTNSCLSINGKTMATSLKTAVTTLPLPVSTTVTSPDVVDLTEEDEDDTINRISSTQRTTPLRQTSSSTHSQTSTITRTSNTINHAHNPSIPQQIFPLRRLPEHVPCDQTIARPQLTITQENATVRLTWNLQATPMESIQNYEIYAYKQNVSSNISDWKKIGTVKSMRLPMAVTLKEFQSNSHYAFAVRAVSINNHIGPFCEPKTIFTGNTSIQPLHTSQLLNVSS